MRSLKHRDKISRDILEITEFLNKTGTFTFYPNEWELYSIRGALKYSKGDYGGACADFLKVVVLRANVLSKPIMSEREDEESGLYLDINDLEHRGWTQALIAKYLSKPDQRGSINHFRNRYFKRLFYIGRVEDIEKNPKFIKEFLLSAKRRRMDANQFILNREYTKGRIPGFFSLLSEENLREIFLDDEIIKMIVTFRRAGYLPAYEGGKNNKQSNPQNDS